jgi:hypothetical protein
MVSYPFYLHSAAVFDSHIPCHGMCESALRVNQTRPHCVNQMGKNGMKGERHGKGRGTAWERQGNDMGKAGERHGMCESALTLSLN